MWDSFKNLYVNFFTKTTIKKRGFNIYLMQVKVLLGRNSKNRLHLLDINYEKMVYLNIKNYSDFFQKCNIKCLMVQNIVIENKLIKLGSVD